MKWECDPPRHSAGHRGASSCAQEESSCELFETLAVIPLQSVKGAFLCVVPVRNLFVDVEGRAFVNLKKDTPHKFLSWTDIIYFERLDYAHLKIQFHSNREYVVLLLILSSNPFEQHYKKRSPQ
eukprot:1195734-Prorocentrum_minimum.AAC.2